jgi:mitogen-activated protein kinase 15
LRRLDHPNIVSLLSAVISRDKNTLFLVLELMPVNLECVIRATNVLEALHKQYVTYQILCGLNHVHSAGLIHMDVKSDNILINEFCVTKLGDFGIAQLQRGSHLDPILTSEYDTQRWTVAPEGILGSTPTTAVDIWAAACVIAEMIRGDVLFKGSSTMNQLSRIFDVVELPANADELNAFCGELNAPCAKTMIDSLWRGEKPRRHVPLRDMLPGADSDSVDMLDKMLQLRSSRRITAKVALDHAYVQDMRDASMERECETPVEPPFTDGRRHNIREHRHLLRSEIAEMHGKWTSRLHYIHTRQAYDDSVAVASPNLGDCVDL